MFCFLPSTRALCVLQAHVYSFRVNDECTAMSAFQAVQACPTLTKPHASRAIGFPLQPFRGSFLPTIPASLTALAQMSPLNHGSGAAGLRNLPYHERTSKLTGLVVVSEHQRSPEFFTKVQHFYKNICCSGCCMPLLSRVAFCFINFVKLYRLFLVDRAFPSSFLCSSGSCCVLFSTVLRPLYL